jgi:4-hydroxy-2-oxoglutarate aldolase
VLYGALEAGAVGGILAVALLAPEECAALCRAYAEGRLADAGRIQERLAPLHRAIVADLGISGMKAALDELGMHGGPPRPPLKPLRAKDLPRARDALAAAGMAQYA